MRAAGEADVIDIARTRQQIADDAGLRRADATGDPIVARQFQPDDEVGAARCSQRSHEFGDNAYAAFPGAAVLVLSPVRPRRQELMEHVPVAGGDLHTGEAAGLQERRRFRNLRDQVTDFRRRQRARHRPRQIVRKRGGADRFGIAPRIVAASSGVLNLAEQATILTFHRIGKPLQPVGIVAPPHLHTRQSRLMPHHAERLGHRHRGSAGGTIGVVLDEPVGDASLRRYEQTHRGMRDPVAQPLAGQLERREERAEIGC